MKGHYTAFLFLLVLYSKVFAQTCPSYTKTVTQIPCNGLNNGSVTINLVDPPITLDGSITEGAWGNPLAIRNSSLTPSFGVGHELNALYTYPGVNTLYIGLAGNVQDQNRILIFVDCKPGGFNNGSFDRSGASFGLFANTFNSGITFDAGFFADYCLTIGTNVTLNNYYLDKFPLLASGANNIYMGDITSSFIKANVANNSLTKGFELAIPWDSLGGLPQDTIKFFCIYESDNGFMSNQFLSAANTGENSYGNNPVNFNAAAPNPVFTLAGKYNWSNGATQLSINNLSPNKYVFYYSNGNGCSFTDTTEIIEPPALSLTASIVTPIICHNDSADINVTISGGTPPYSGTSAGVAKYFAGTHVISVTDNKGCTDDTTIVMTNPPQIKLGLSQVLPTCYGDSGIVTLGLSGGVAPYTGTGTYTVSSGPYSFLLSDSLGCSVLANGNIGAPTPSAILALSANSNANNVAGATCDIKQINQGDSITYVDASCHLIAAVKDDAGGSVPATTEVCADVAANAFSFNSRAVTPRSFTINAANNTAANITFYLTDEDFMAYNGLNTNHLALGTHSGGITSTPAVVLFDDGNAVTMINTNATYNTNTNYWHISFSAPAVNGTYYVSGPDIPLSASDILLTGNRNNNDVYLRWQVLGNINEITAYQIYGGTQPTQLSLIDVRSNNGSSTFNALYENMNNNYFIVRAINSNGTSLQSNLIQLAASSNFSYVDAINKVLVVQCTKSDMLNISVINASGKIMYQQSAFCAAGLHRFDLSSIASAVGVNYIKISGRQNTVVLPYLVQ